MIAAESGLPFGAIGSADRVTMLVSLRRKKSSRNTSRETLDRGERRRDILAVRARPELDREAGVVVGAHAMRTAAPARRVPPPSPFQPCAQIGASCARSGARGL